MDALNKELTIFHISSYHLTDVSLTVTYVLFFQLKISYNILLYNIYKQNRGFFFYLLNLIVTKVVVM